MRRVNGMDWVVAAGLLIMALVMLAQLAGCAAAAAGADQGMIVAKLRADVSAEVEAAVTAAVETRIRGELNAELQARLEANLEVKLAELNVGGPQTAGGSINNPWLIGLLAALPYGSILLHELLKRLRHYRTLVDWWKGKPEGCRW